MPASSPQHLHSAYSHGPGTAFLARSWGLSTASLGLQSHMKAEEKLLPTCVHGHVAKSSRHRQALPLHPCVEEPQDEVKDTVIAQFALGTTLGHREVRQDKCLKFRFRELDRNRCRCRRWCRGAHHAMASWEEERCALGKQITSDTTRG